MLVITRKVNESLVIGGDIEISVVSVEDGKIRLGVNAPREVKIYRKEIYEEIKAENRRAAVTGRDILGHLPGKSAEKTEKV